MRAVVIQHLDVEGPAHIATALDAAGVEVDVIRADLGQRIPEDLDGIDGLVVMGGPMSARSDDGFPTRGAEIALLRQALDREVPTLGVCLGAQLLAAAAGARVIAGHGLEVGWGAVEVLECAVDDDLFFGLDGHLDVLHWHGETYSLPAGAIHLARSQAYEQQAFRVGRCTWGLQFHLEVGVDEATRFIDSFPDEADAALGGRHGVREGCGPAVEALAPVRDLVVARFAALVARR
ncbi:MAG: type 1 glutamine amidotransferase [Microthrixaceae bacterium]|nr:type 1 glutamine amidotransferase [Microthrixaceae bacterium]HPB45819.1 type 1 glutamine amidotransferase [Microthrixaceae bacterium]